MAREMFNPNFSLFVPVPEGGTTFQPNPNSIVQNDAARHTNHLDFFKFVGRIVGKALFDGQFVDAYFTRSLYKHMLDMPLTYLVFMPPLSCKRQKSSLRMFPLCLQQGESPAVMKALAVWLDQFRISVTLPRKVKSILAWYSSAHPGPQSNRPDALLYEKS